MSDFETFTKTKKTNNIKRSRKDDKSDFISMTAELFDKVNIKISFFLFILGILIFSDTFAEMFLIDIPGALDETDCPTSQGTILQLLMLTFGYLIIDLLSKGEII